MTSIDPNADNNWQQYKAGEDPRDSQYSTAASRAIDVDDHIKSYANASDYNATRGLANSGNANAASASINHISGQIISNNRWSTSNDTPMAYDVLIRQREDLLMNHMQMIKEMKEHIKELEMQKGIIETKIKTLSGIVGKNTIG